jgi:Leucine-rich repeat (LRR) protein
MSNSISSLKSYFFDKFASLNSINFQSNKLKLLLNYSFSNLDNLFVISLDNNLLEEIQSYSFFNLPKIEIISLRFNRIKLIGDLAFVSLNTYIFVDLFNSATFLTETFRNSFTNTSHIRVSYQSLKNLNVLELDLKECKIETLFHNSIDGDFVYLNLESNVIASMESRSFGKLKFLKEINFANNLIKKLNFYAAFAYDLKNLEKLDFKFNLIDSIDSWNFFTKFPNLTSLDLSQNRLRSLTKSHFLNLFNLKYLFLSSNLILTIDYETFVSLPNLVHLDSGNNLIYDIEHDESTCIFSYLNNLRELILAKNQIESLNIKMAANNSLNLIDLSHNKIRNLTKDSFESIKKIKILNLSDNLIMNLNDSLSVLENIEFLDFSSNNLTSFRFANLKNLSSLKLDKSKYLSSIEMALELTSLSLSNSNSSTVMSIDFPTNSKLVELDLSFNNLAHLRSNYFFNLKNLKTLYLRNTNMIDFEFLLDLKTHLTKLDISLNQNFGKLDYYLLKELKHLSFLSSSKTLVKNLPIITNKFEYLDFSFNQLSSITNIGHDSLIYLDLSHNQIKEFEGNEIEVKFFTKLRILKFVNLSKSFTQALSNRVFFFNKQLETGHFSMNSLLNLPVFCQYSKYDWYTSDDIKSECLECQLKTLYFDSNRLEAITNTNFIGLKNLEYLSLENNSIASIQTQSFSNLVKLKTLLLSRNNLKHLNDTLLFASLFNLNFLNLSFNHIESIQAYLFNDLRKLEHLDLSCNRIVFLERFAFRKLSSLKTLWINENDKRMRIESSQVFDQLVSIQNFYLSRSILDDTNNLNVFLILFEQSKTYLNKTVQGKNYYKSLFLMANYARYDCEMTLFFMRNNVHFNFKTESHISNYFAECSLLVIKNTSSYETNYERRTDLVLRNFLFHFFIWTLLLIVLLGVYLCIGLRQTK